MRRLSAETEDWLMRWAFVQQDANPALSLTRQIIAELAPYRPSRPVKLYRFALHPEAEHLHDLRSFTSACGFAETMEEEAGGRGRLITATVKPNRILVDFTRLPKYLRDQLPDETIVSKGTVKSLPSTIAMRRRAG